MLYLTFRKFGEYGQGKSRALEFDGVGEISVRLPADIRKDFLAMQAGIVKPRFV